MQVRFTESFFKDWVNEPFLSAVKCEKVYSARKLNELQKIKRGANYDFLVDVPGYFVCEGALGFFVWQDVVPARVDEVEIVNANTSS